MLLRGLLLVLLVSILYCVLTSTVLAGESLNPHVDLTFDQLVYGSSQDIFGIVTISNPGSTEIKVLRWFTPVDGIYGDLFDISLDGSSVAYTGALYKRGKPRAEDYLTLQPGESIKQTVDLANYYDLSLPGTYQISFRVSAYDLLSHPQKFSKEFETIQSKQISLWINGTPRAPNKTPTVDQAYSNTFTGCTASRQNEIIASRSAAYAYSQNGYNYLSAGNQGSQYTTWFGVYSATRYNLVRSHFQNISAAYREGAVNFDCTETGCPANTFAYVFGSDPLNNIYLCSVFWLVPTTGTDSKGGTLVHEMSHFSRMGGTSDFAYGQTDAMALAISSPANAVMNADSHEYFGESFSPTGSLVTVSGRVTRTDGVGIRNAILTISSAGGTAISVRSNSFGYYSLPDLPTGSSYVLQVAHKSYVFESNTRVIALNDNVSDADFIGTL